MEEMEVRIYITGYVPITVQANTDIEANILAQKQPLDMTKFVATNTHGAFVVSNSDNKNKLGVFPFDQ